MLGTIALFDILKITRRLLPESSRWLLTMRQNDRAEKSLRLMTVVNGKEWPKNFEITSIKINQVL